MNFDWYSLPLAVQVLDISICVVVVIYTIVVIIARTMRSAGVVSDSERGMAVAAVGNFVTVNVAAASIILTGVGVIAGLQLKGSVDSPQVATQLSLTGVWLATSLLCGGLTAAYVISLLHRDQSVAQNTWVLGYAVAQLGCTFGGASYLAIMLFLL